MKTVINYEISNVEMLEEQPNSQFATARIEAFSTGTSRHDTTCDVETLKRTAPTIYEKPIIFEVDNRFGDFGTHSQMTIPAGFVVSDTAEFKEQPDGRTTLSVFAKIWKKYSGKFLEIFKDTNTDKKKVSVEIEVNDAEKTSDGLLNLKDFAYAAICVLGDYVTEASQGANMTILSFANQEKEEYEKALIKEFSKKYDEVDFLIPNKIKQNAKEGLELNNKFSKTGTSVSIAFGRWLIRNEQITPEKARFANKYFENHKGDNLEDKQSSSWISWQLMGGSENKRWSSKLVSQLDKVDEMTVSYFEKKEGEIMPYSSLKDINPALKGIEPPITLSQANEIARQADAVGADKGGWGIAIKHFKESHKVEDGVWIKKEKSKKEMSMADKDEIKKEEEKETPAEEKVETPEKEKEEVEKGEEKKFSLASVDFSAALDVMGYSIEMSDEGKTKVAMAVEELKKGAEFADVGTVVAGMFAMMYSMKESMCKMSEDAKTYMAENEELKKFRADVEAEKKSFAVDSTLKELAEKVIIPEGVLEEMKAEAQKFSFADLEGWKNYCKAKSFDFAVKPTKDKSHESEVVKLGFPFIGNTKSKDDLWV